MSFRGGSRPVRSKTTLASGAPWARASNGSSILEVLIAVAALTLGIAASTLLVFASQSVKLDGETSASALYMARDVLENARASSTADFNSVVSAATTTDGIYVKKLDVFDLTPCRKEAASRITWSTEVLRPQKIELHTDFTDIQEALALGGDCASEPPVGGWTFPAAAGSIDLGPGEEATGIDAMGKIVFLSATSSNPVKPDLFAVDAADGSHPVILSSADTGMGLNAIDVARDGAGGSTFAYAASNATSRQLHIIDVDAAHHFAHPALVGVADLKPAPLGTNSEGRSIFYYDKKVYIGTHYLPSLGSPRPEFHIFDVSDPAHPVELGSYDVNHTINAIIVRGNYAYLATSDDAGEVWILKIDDPASPTFVNKFNAAGSEDGDSIYLVGNALYLGRNHAPSSRPDFYVLDITDPMNVGVRGSKNLSMSPSTAKVNAIRVSGRFAFLATGDADQELQVLDISRPENIPAPLGAYDSPQEATGIDFENNVIYASVRSNDALRVIRPAP